MNWDEIIAKESSKDYFVALNTFLEKEYSFKNIYPPKEDVFNAFKYCKFEDVKVIILGQDPYHEKGQATGLSFSVPSYITLPPSLKNIFKELENDLGIHKENGDLSCWAKQGVFLLNITLTVEEHLPLSHFNKGWEIFTNKILRYLNDDDKPKVFILWGKNAINKKKIITNSKHLILESVHPSPLSAYHGFFNNHHFSKTNEFLIKNNIKPIEW